MSDLPTRTPAGTIYEIEALHRWIEERDRPHRVAKLLAQNWIWTQYTLDCRWAMYSVSGAPKWGAWLFAYFAPRINPQRLLTAGDKLVRGCSHADAIPTFDHRVPPWVFAPPVGLTCPTCGTIMPYAANAYEVWMNFDGMAAR